MYIYPYVSPQHICICISEFVFVPHMQNCSDMYHVVCTQYLFTVVINKVQMCSSQFNLTRMFLNSLVACFLGLMILFHLLVNCLRVVWIDCLRQPVCLLCLFSLWIPPVMYDRHILCLRCLQVAPFFSKKMVWRQAWREADVRRQTSAPSHLTVWRQTRQLSPWLWKLLCCPNLFPNETNLSSGCFTFSFFLFFFFTLLGGKMLGTITRCDRGFKSIFYVFWNQFLNCSWTILNYPFHIL